MLVLDTHDTTTPVSSEFFVVVILFSENFAKIFEILHVFLVNFSNSEASSGLHVNEFAEVGLATDEAVGYLLLAAKGWQVDDSLNWVYIMSHDDQLGFALLNKGGHVVKTEFEVKGFVSLLLVFLLSGGLKSKFLHLFGLGRVFSKHLEKFGGLVLVDGVRELVDGWGNLETLHEDGLLSLNADVLRPFDETSKVTFGLNITSDSEVTRVLGEQRTLIILLGSSIADDDLLSLYSFLNLISKSDTDCQLGSTKAPARQRGIERNIIDDSR